MFTLLSYTQKVWAAGFRLLIKQINFHQSCIMVPWHLHVGPYRAFIWWWGLVKMSPTMVGQQHKTKKKHWLKHPEAEKGNLTKIYIIQNLIFGIRFFIISAIQLYNIRSHVSVDNIRVFLNFGFSSRMSQSQQKLEKRSLKKPHSF